MAKLSKHRVATSLARYAINPLVRSLFRLGIPPPGTAILETRGRRSGQLRHTPVTDGLSGNTFWIVAEHGWRAAYVLNIEADPHVRVKVGRRWRSGTATIMPDDDPHERLRRISAGRRRSLVNTATVRLMQTDLLTVRIALDPS